MTPSKYLLCGDMLELLPLLSALDLGDISMVFADLPYGKTGNKWDIKIDLCELWKLLPNCTCVFTASNGFEFELFNSNPTQYNYKWVWNKNNSAGFALAKKRPLNVTEDILVFRNSAYFPIMEERGKVRKKGGYASSSNYGIVPSTSHNNTYYPKSLLNVPNASQIGKRHPTQKPIDLLAYLVQTYTLPGQVVLDPCMGSGSTCEACMRTGRSFIGIEKDPVIFAETESYLNNLPSSESDNDLLGLEDI